MSSITDLSAAPREATISGAPGAQPNSPVSCLVLTAAAEKSSLLPDLLALAKIRLTAMVVITTAVGFILASPDTIHWFALLAAALGTWLLAGSAAALNQWLEITPDSRMNRTRSRPLPTGRLLPSTALLFATLTLSAGVLVLLWGANPLTTLLGLANLIIYAFIYTPLKRLSSLNTLVGAICGAIPPMMGCAAATGTLGPPAYILAALLFVWQIPHFLSLAWLYRDDYARAGFRMLPIIDSTGRLTCRMIVLYSLLLIPVSLAACLFDIAGGWYGLLCIFLGLAMVFLAANLARNRTRQAARRVFLASVAYLPLLLILMVAGSSTSR
jgi:protoheme IX farnesyltransferase